MKRIRRVALMAILVLMLAGCTVSEYKDDVYVEIDVENVSTIGFQRTGHSGAASHADGSTLGRETLKLDLDIERGETFTLTARDADGHETARGTFTYDGGAMMIVLSEDGFALKDKPEE